MDQSRKPEVPLRLKTCRIVRHMSQDELARQLRAAGLNWVRTTVWKVEAGERGVSLNEFAVLCRVLAVRPADLVETEWQSMFSGAEPESWLPSDHLPHQLSTGELQRRNWKVAFGMNMAELEAMGDAERKAAKRLRDMGHDMDARTVVDIAYRLWDRSLTDERDRRLGDTNDLAPRALQARRGHITRELLGELVSTIEKETTVKKSTRAARRGKRR